MDTSYKEEDEEGQAVITTSISRSNVATPMRDNREPYQKQLAVYLILGSLLCERAAFYSIAANIVLSLGSDTPIPWSYTNTLIASFIFSGTTYFSTMIFAVISDAKLGRAKTIIVGFFIYLVGFISTILITNSDTRDLICEKQNGNNTLTSTTLFNEPCVRGILPTLIVIAIGAGAVQSNMAVLGAEQMQESTITSRFFDKYMMAVNIGSVIAKMGIPSINNPTYYYIGYTGAAGILFLASVLFIIGWRYYIHVTPYDTIICSCIPVYRNAFQTRRKYKQQGTTIRREQLNSTAPPNSSNTLNNHTSDDELARTEEPSLSCLDYAKVINHGNFQEGTVDDVKSLGNAFVVFGFFIPYWMIYSQVYSSFALQGGEMDTIGEPRWVSWISLGDPISIIIGILILNVFIYHRLDTHNRTITIATKFVIGMCFASVAMFIAGTVEVLRQQGCKHPCGSNQSSSLKIFYQLLQNVGVGLSEVFAMVASYEYAYSAAPRSAKSLFMSLRFCSLGISSLIGFGYTTIFSSFSLELDFSCSTNKGWLLFTYFYVLAGFQLVFIILFIVCQHKYRFIKLN